MKKATATKGLPILGITEGASVGSVEKMIIYPSTKSVVYLTISENTLVKLSDCVGIGNDCVVIQSKDSVKKIYDDRDIAEIMDKSLDITGLKVMSDEGNVLGKVTDFEYDRRSGALVSVDIDNGETAEAGRVLSISANLMFVAAAGNAEEQPAPAGTEAAEPVDETYEYLLGKKVNGSVKSDDGLFSLEAGSELTRAILDDAKKHDALLKIALYVD